MTAAARGSGGIRTEALSRDFGSVRALDGVTLDIPGGTVFGFLGPNGAGKTTTIRLLLGLLAPSAGRADVLGFDTMTGADEIRARTGALLEHPGLYERLSAEDNLEFYGRVWQLPAAPRRERIRELLSRLGLWDRRHEVVRGWSRGMKQKLAIARAVLHRPQVVFLDEPTNGLDPAASAALRQDLADLATREGVTIFLTTHNLVEAERLCSLIGIIRRGKLMALGHPSELRAGNGVERARVVGRGFTDTLVSAVRARAEVTSVSVEGEALTVELAPGARVAGLVTLLAAGGAEIEEVQRHRPSLEEVYLALMGEEAS